MERVARCRTGLISLLSAFLFTACGSSGVDDAGPIPSYGSHEDILAAMEDGGYECDAVDVRVRDREGQQLTDSNGVPVDPELESAMLEYEASIRSQGISGWSTCWWRDDRLEMMIFESEAARLQLLVSSLGYGCAALPGGRTAIPYLHGEDWAVLPGWAETTTEEMRGIADAVGGAVVEARCDDLVSAVESWGTAGTDFAEVPLDELKATLGEGTTRS